MAIKDRIKLLICDDHQIIIDGMNMLIKDADDIDVVDEANNGRQVMDVVARRKIDLILMDINMPEMNGIETTQAVKEKYPSIQIIGLTMMNDGPIINKMLDAGASGYILKTCGKDELLTAIRKVAAGGKYLSSEVSETMLNQYTDMRNKAKNRATSNMKDQLTNREIEIVRLIADGLSNAEIAEKLIRSPRTIDTHRTNIMKKVGVHNIAGLIKYAMNNGLLE